MPRRAQHDPQASERGDAPKKDLLHAIKHAKARKAQDAGESLRMSTSGGGLCFVIAADDDDFRGLDASFVFFGEGIGKAAGEEVEGVDAGDLSLRIDGHCAVVLQRDEEAVLKVRPGSRTEQQAMRGILGLRFFLSACLQKVFMPSQRLVQRGWMRVGVERGCQWRVHGA